MNHWKRNLLALSIAAASASTSAIAGPWIQLFNGSSTEHFRGYNQDGFPEGAWVIDADTLKTNPDGPHVDLITKEKFVNYELEFEWKVSRAGNSGVIYNVMEGPGASYMSGPEMQILDDARHPDGRNERTSAGSLYALIAPNAKKRTNPQGVFNWARLVVKQGHVEHWLNGELVVEYEWRSPEIRDLISESKFNQWEDTFMTQNGGHIAFQHHGEEVWYRNIRIRRLDETNNSLTDAEKRDGWELLFDGETTNAWRGSRSETFPDQGWTVQDGWLVHGDKAGGGDIVTRERYEEFEFSWEWKIAEGSNSGVKYFVVPERGSSIGHEYQVIDDSAHADALRGDKYTTAAFYDVFPPADEDKLLQPIGGVNRSRIVVKGDTAQHWLNGALVLEYQLGSQATLAAVSQSKFKNTDRFGQRLSGHILLQDHSDEVWYRNLKIRDLAD